MNDDKVRLLLVDDLPENLAALEALIGRADLETHKADSGTQALELLLTHDFALAILDVQMPGMDGFELAEFMRGTERTKHIPIVFVSAGSQELNYAFKGYETGAVDFLHKPLDVHAVRSKVNVFVDLYRQKRTLSRQLRALQEAQLEQEMLMAELQKTQAELQLAIRNRDDFLSAAAHELKTPLNVLKLHAQMRERHLKHGDNSAFSGEKFAKMVTRESRLVETLVRQIDDMLDISRIRTGKLYLRPTEFDLGEMVDDTVGQFSEQLAATGNDLHLTIARHIVGRWDQFRLEQVLTNLVTNAMRYAPGTPLEITVTRHGSGARIAVRDHGPGIPQEHQQRIFQQFEQASGGASGLGLGLYISKQIVEAHGGDIFVQSIPGGGATFLVELPLEGGSESEG
ncbi:hybrid sensor histidine kinase/response regulator [Chitiniphilus eburneus]|uniref:histidine kinase n=1 Tax=Chitiniphilus eburneus TaxID=2571148 RepID=A0A4U0PUC1_9NEIS|nr:hybrid sensor histidine kinase/response regulator [Chitiniphilus eburneus]TJZ72027.1 hybrid sensor histidine kinase/response regulator [Chitiniphilus eburneus]